MRGRLTYHAEGNENPNSSNYSKKLRIDERRGLVIGRGYRLYEKTDHNIIQDMQALGVDNQLVSTMRKIHKCRGEEAKKALEKTNGSICLTKDQESKLFEKEYETCLLAIQNFISNNMYAYGTLKFQKMPEYQQDILVDLYFAGDFDLKIQNLLLTALGKTAKSASDEIFNELMRDIELWKQLHVNPDRIKRRIIHIRESSSSSKIVVKEEKSQLIYGVPQEVVSSLIIKRPEEYIVLGYQIDYSTEELLFILKPNLSVTDGRGKEGYEGINFADFITCLSILYDDSIKNKCFGIAHVADPNNPEAEENSFSLKNLKKVVYPDVLENRSIIKGTKIEQDLAEILDLIHGLAYGNSLSEFKNTTSETQNDEETKVFQSVRVISSSGAKVKLIRSTSAQKHHHANAESASAIINLKSRASVPKLGAGIKKITLERHNSSSRLLLDRTLYIGPKNAEMAWMNRLARLWINPKKISVLDYVIDNLNEYFTIRDVELKLEPKQMKMPKPNLIDDVPIDGTNHPAANLISQWPELSSKLVKYFPKLQRYTQIIKAWALAEKIYKKKVPLDLESLRLIMKRHKEGVAQKGYSGSPKKAQRSASTGRSRKTDDDANEMRIKQKKISTGIEAGLIGIMIEPSEGILHKSSPEVPTKGKKENDRDKVAQNFFRDYGMEEKNRQKKEIVALEKGTFKLKFPLLKKESCSICEKSLSFLEVCSSLGNKHLCSLHHPKSCQRCYRMPQGENVVTLGDHVYHMDCMVCQKCKKPLSLGNTIRTNEYFMHIKCPDLSSSGVKKVSYVVFSKID